MMVQTQCCSFQGATQSRPHNVTRVGAAAGDLVEARVYCWTLESCVPTGRTDWVAYRTVNFKAITVKVVQKVHIPRGFLSAQGAGFAFCKAPRAIVGTFFPHLNLVPMQGYRTRGTPIIIIRAARRTGVLSAIVQHRCEQQLIQNCLLFIFGTQAFLQACVGLHEGTCGTYMYVSGPTCVWVHILLQH